MTLYRRTVAGELVPLTEREEAERRASWDQVAKVTPNQVKAEAARRLEAGAVIEVTGYGPIPVRGRDDDKIVFLSLGDTARDLLAAGVSDPLLPFRDRDNVRHSLTPTQTLELVRKATAVAQAIYQASWDMIDDPNGIPEDYATNEDYWP